MADPKYENLPGIAYDQPDVYETSDLPESEQPEEFTDEENECIEKIDISVGDSFIKFKGKQVYGNVDFSDRISKKIRTGYKCGEYGLAAQGETETPQERYQRLRCETTELLEQLIVLQEQGPEDDKETMKQMAKQVASTKQVLDELNFDFSTEADSQADQFKKLLNQIAETKGIKNENVATTVIKLKPDSSNLSQTTRLAQLEHRLHKLEAVVGPAPTSLERLSSGTDAPAGLLRCLPHLLARLSLLQPSQLDAAEQRIARILPAMDQLKANAPPYDPERDAKINELFETIKKCEGISHTQLLERMQALESLHKQASDFSKSLNELEALKISILSSVQSNKVMLQGVQEVFANNLEHIQKEIKKLEDRIGNVGKK